jgi:hypothetical protein
MFQGSLRFRLVQIALRNGKLRLNRLLGKIRTLFFNLKRGSLFTRGDLRFFQIECCD